jgi:hypothetical protein
MSDLTAKEQTNVRVALRFLRARVGAEPLAKVLHAHCGTIARILNGGRAATASIAVRVARFAKVGVDDVLEGRFPPPGACPHCGHVSEEVS